jgi:hypothetical protein
LSRHGDGKLLAFLGRQAAKCADRNLGILRLDRRRDIGRRQLVFLQLERIQPDPHGVAGAEDIDTADAFQTLDGVFDLGGEDVAKVDGITFPIRGDERADHQDAGCRARNLDTGLLHDIGQLRLNKLQLVLHLNLRDVGKDAVAEGEGDRRSARARGRTHICKVVEAGHAVFNNRRHRLLDRFGTRAVIARRDLNSGRSDLRILRDRQRCNCKRAPKHDDDRDDPGENRSPDEELCHSDYPCGVKRCLCWFRQGLAASVLGVSMTRPRSSSCASTG